MVLALALAPAAPRAHEAERAGECTASSPRFRVGHTIRALHVKGTLGEDRPIQVHLWYPARERDECDEATDAEGGFGECHAPAAVYTSRLHGVPLLPQWSPLAWSIASRIAFEDAGTAEGDGRFPVIVFSHGNTNNAIDHAYLLEALASYGYIVAAPDHLNNTQDEVRIDYVNGLAGKTVIPCLDGLDTPCSQGSGWRVGTLNVPKSMVDRYHDVEAVLDSLQSWFGHRVDMERVGIMGHSRGTVTSLALAGGSTTWGFQADPRIKALMGLAIGIASITAGADVQKVTVPALLVGGTLDTMSPLSVTTTAFTNLASTDKHLVVVQNAVHRHFDSAYCAEMLSSGLIAEGNAAAVLDLQTATQIIKSPNSGLATDFCGYDSFFKSPAMDVRPLVKSVSGFTVTPTNVPTHGLTSDMVKDEVVSLAVAFFGRVLNRAEGDDRPFKDCLPEKYRKQP